MQEFRRHVPAGGTHGEEQWQQVFFGRMHPPEIGGRVQIREPGNVPVAQAFVDPVIEVFCP